LIVVDASVLAPALSWDTAEAGALRQRLRGQRVFAPELIDVEVTSYIRRAHRAGVLGLQRTIQALGDLATLPLSRVSHTPLLSRIWDLRDNLTPCDAAYVALAEALDAPLLTGDARLARAPGVRCEIQLLT
jgi:predicted nucleic acid-binding protein